MLVRKQSKTQLLAAAPPLFSGIFVFVGLMITGLGIMMASLSVLAVKMKKLALIAVFIFPSFVLYAWAICPAAALPGHG